MILEDLIHLINLRLKMFGYNATEQDKPIIEYQAEEAAQYVCTFCNFKKCPDDVPGALKLCAEHGTNLAGASPVTGIYRQV